MRLLQRFLIAIVMVIVVLFFSSVQTTYALVETSYHVYCNGYTMTGTATSAFIQMYVHNDTTNTILVSDYVAPYINFQVFKAAGSAGAYTFNITVHYPAQQDGSSIYFATWSAPSGNPHDADGVPYPSLTARCHGLLAGSGSAVLPLYTDGRLNNMDVDESVAIYCQADGSVKVLSLYKGKGFDAFIATSAEIASIPKNPDQNTLIKSGNGASLYRLHGGLLQVNRPEDGTGKMYSFTFTDCLPAVQIPSGSCYQDGRLNRCDPGATVAVYCLADGSVKVLAIYESKGYDAILATPDEINSVPYHPSVNTEIKSGNGVMLYRLTGGELQVNRTDPGSGKMYTFTFPQCPIPAK